MCEKRDECPDLPGGSVGGAAASSIVLIVDNRLIFVSKRQKVYRLALAPLSLHTSSIDVPSPDVNPSAQAQ